MSLHIRPLKIRNKYLFATVWANFINQMRGRKEMWKTTSIPVTFWGAQSQGEGRKKK
jgi:hypothetical protein